jgi:hypothetical protein
MRLDADEKPIHPIAYEQLILSLMTIQIPLE